MTDDSPIHADDATLPPGVGPDGNGEMHTVLRSWGRWLMLSHAYADPRRADAALSAVIEDLRLGRSAGPRPRAEARYGDRLDDTDRTLTIALAAISAFYPVIKDYFEKGGHTWTSETIKSLARSACDTAQITARSVRQEIERAAAICAASFRRYDPPVRRARGVLPVVERCLSMLHVTFVIPWVVAAVVHGGGMTALALIPLTYFTVAAAGGVVKRLVAALEVWMARRALRPGPNGPRMQEVLGVIAPMGALGRIPLERMFRSLTGVGRIRVLASLDPTYPSGRAIAVPIAPSLVFLGMTAAEDLKSMLVRQSLPTDRESAPQDPARSVESAWVLAHELAHVLDLNQFTRRSAGIQAVVGAGVCLVLLASTSALSGAVSPVLVCLLVGTVLVRWGLYSRASRELHADSTATATLLASGVPHSVAYSHVCDVRRQWLLRARGLQGERLGQRLVWRLRCSSLLMSFDASLGLALPLFERIDRGTVYALALPGVVLAALGGWYLGVGHVNWLVCGVAAGVVVGLVFVSTALLVFALRAFDKSSLEAGSMARVR
jgi:hypothetical protein